MNVENICLILIDRGYENFERIKKAAENKGLRHEVNKWDPTIYRWETDKEPNPDFMKIEIGIEYRPNIWAWFDGFCKEDVKDDDLTLFFRETYNQVCGRQNKTFRRGWKVERQLFGNGN